MGLLPKKEKYSNEKVEKLHKYLQNYADRGQPIDFEILVDDFKAVRRTNDPELFYDFAPFVDFINGGTKNIEIIFYQGSSNHNDRYIFTFEEEKKEAGLDGLEIESRIQEGVNKARKEWDLEQLKKDYEEWKAYAGELEEDVDRLEKQLDELRSNMSPLHGLLGEFGSSFVSGMVKQNPQMLSKIPGLSGLVEENKKENQDTEATTFTPSNEAENLEAQEALKFIKFLRKKFTQEQFGQVMNILDILTEKPDKVEEVLTLLK